MWQSIILVPFLLILASCYHDEFETSMSIAKQGQSNDFVCKPSEQRCNGNFKQSCNLKGEWEDIDCPMGYTCFEVDHLPICQIYDQIETDVFLVDLSFIDGSQDDMQDGMQDDMQDDMQGDMQGGVMVETQVCENNCPEIEMILIQAGLFNMGSDNGVQNEQPIHNVQILSQFYVGKTEVTVGQYRICVNAGICTKPNRGMFCGWTDEISSLENTPINCVDWIQARVFAKWVGGDLMTEAQWEYVATAQGQNITYPWGDTEPSCLLANYRSCGTKISAVCSTSMGNTAQGVCDMGGNVWEWVLDEYHDSYVGSPQDEHAWCSEMSDCNPMSPLDQRIFRGGSWYDEGWRLKSTFRDHYTADYRDHRLGFRIAKPKQ